MDRAKRESRNKKPAKAEAPRDPFEAALDAIQAAPDKEQYSASVNVDCARAGNQDAALDVLSDYADAVDAIPEAAWPKGPLYYVTARYLADCFRAILTHEEPARALNLVKGKGRPTGARLFDEDALAAMYWFLVRKGTTKTRAIVEIEREIGADKRTIRRAARTFDVYAASDRIPTDGLKAAFKPYAARVGKILARL